MARKYFRSGRHSLHCRNWIYQGKRMNFRDSPFCNGITSRTHLHLSDDISSFRFRAAFRIMTVFLVQCLWCRHQRVGERETQNNPGRDISPFDGYTTTIILPHVKPLSAMNVTTVHGSICMDYVSSDHDCRKCPVPLPHSCCSTQMHDHEGERKRFPLLAYQSRRFTLEIALLLGFLAMARFLGWQDMNACDNQKVDL